MTDQTAPHPRRSPLHELHERLGASFTDFAGWLMPVRYTSDLAEHHAVRTAAGIFDISHMAEFEIEGTDASAYLDHALAGRLSSIEAGQAKYTLLLTESGGIVDDLIVYRQGENQFLIVANAGNHDPVLRELTSRAESFDVQVTDLSDSIALIAVQGPAAKAVLEATHNLAVASLDALKYYRYADATFDGVPLLIARTGYTGEDGFELYIRTDSAAALWEALTEAGVPLGLTPAGLASRDTLRLEAGMPLYGHELGLDTFPVQAGLRRVVATTKARFVGKDAIEAGPGEGARVLVGLVSEGKRAGRAGYPVLDETGEREVGVVTSGALSPTLGYPIAMAYVDPECNAPGTRLLLDIRGTSAEASVVSLPFYTREQS